MNGKNRRIRFLIAGVAASVCLVAAFQVRASDPATAGETGAAVTAAGDIGAAALLERVQAFYEKTTDFKASFRQVVRRKSPRRTLTRSGTVYFKRPGMMRWDYKVPDEVYYVSDGEILWSYDVEDGVAYRLQVKGSDLFHALGFLTGTARLTDSFDPTVDKATAAGLVPIRLAPRDAQAGYRAITLFVDPATGETRETSVEDPLGNVSHLWFEQPSKSPLPPDGFRFKVPAGVRVEEIGPR
jgi:outer membrane lipoprotein carrier protein